MWPDRNLAEIILGSSIHIRSYLNNPNTSFLSISENFYQSVTHLSILLLYFNCTSILHQAKYQYYIVQRQPDEGQSEALRVPIGNTAAQLTGLDLGRHCVSVQLSGTGAPSPYSVEHCVCLQGRTHFVA